MTLYGQYSHGRVSRSDPPGVRFQPGPGSNFLAGAGETDSGLGFLVKIWSPVRFAEFMKLFENLEKIVILLVVEILVDFWNHCTII